MNKDLAKMGLIAIFSLITVIICCLVCSSCKSIQYVPVETVRTEHKYEDRLQRDSIHLHDSIFIFMRGDTVFRDRWHMEYKNRFVYDTTYVSKTDTIRIPYPVEKKFTRWETVKMELGGWAFGTVTAFILIAVCGLIYKLRKRSLLT